MSLRIEQRGRVVARPSEGDAPVMMFVFTTAAPKGTVVSLIDDATGEVLDCRVSQRAHPFKVATSSRRPRRQTHFIF